MKNGMIKGMTSIYLMQDKSSYWLTPGEIAELHADAKRVMELARKLIP